MRSRTSIVIRLFRRPGVMVAATFILLALFSIPKADIAPWQSSEFESSKVASLVTKQKPAAAKPKPKPRPPFNYPPLEPFMTDEELYALMLREQQEADRLFYGIGASPPAPDVAPPETPAPAPPPVAQQAIAYQPPPVPAPAPVQYDDEEKSDDKKRKGRGRDD